MAEPTLPKRTLPQRTLSVIVPVKDAAATLPKLLGRLTALQPPPGWRVEILAGLNPSRDESELLLRRHGVKVVRCNVLGPAAARNAAARAASGLLYYFIDADACPQGDDFYRRLIGYAIGLAKRGRFGAYGGAILLDPAQA
ncbi:MAG: glycosyltransferase, partial [Kiloniellales bacterium]